MAKTAPTTAPVADAAVAPEAPAAVITPEATEQTIEVNGVEYVQDKQSGAFTAMRANASSNPRLTPSEFVTDPVRDPAKVEAKFTETTVSGSIRRDY